jgi:hypothetical protein
MGREAGRGVALAARVARRCSELGLVQSGETIRSPICASRSAESAGVGGRGAVLVGVSIPARSSVSR